MVWTLYLISSFEEQGVSIVCNSKLATIRNAVSTGNKRFRYDRRNGDSVKPPVPDPSILKKGWGGTWVYLP